MNIITDENGRAIIKDVPVGSRLGYLCSHENYESINGVYNVVDGINVLNKVMNRVEHLFDVTFIVQDTNSNPVFGALISFGIYGGLTDENGICLLMDVPEGNYNATISHEDFIEKQVQINVNADLQPVTVTLEHISPTPQPPTGAFLRYMPMIDEFDDVTGNGNNGTPTNVSYDANGDAVFNGTAYVTLINQQELGTVFTLNALLKHTEYTPYSSVGGNYSGNNGLRFASLGHDSTALWFGRPYGDSSIDTAELGTVNTRFNFITMVINGTSVEVYINGELKKTFTTSATTPNLSLFIGKDGVSNAGLKGVLKAFDIYKRVLTQSEIQQDMNYYQYELE